MWGWRRAWLGREIDRIAVVYGCSTAVLICETGESEARWLLLGECYVYRLMDGQVRLLKWMIF